MGEGWASPPRSNGAAGLGGKGNEGVTALVQQTPGAIGYIELIYALNNHIPFADIKNHGGQLVTASLTGVTAAGDAARAWPIACGWRYIWRPTSGFRSPTPRAPIPIQSLRSPTCSFIGSRPTKPRVNRSSIFLKWALHDGQPIRACAAICSATGSVVALEDKQISRFACRK